MKKQFAIFLIGIFWIKTSLAGLSLELNTSYDYFRGLPDGSWNGNNGAFVMANLGANFFDSIGAQLGGSVGIYNWDGKGNVVFKNRKKGGQVAFLTAGLFSSFKQFNIGIVYDRLFTRRLGNYSVNPSIDQVRFQGGYQFCSEEVGIGGAVHVTTAHKRVWGIPLSFRAIDQLNLFWTHFFDNFATTTCWLGVPYQNSLRFRHGQAGAFLAGFSLRAPLTERLFIDGHGVYLKAKKTQGWVKSRNYGANICIGITYLFGNECPRYRSTYLPVANHSNFLTDANINH